MVEIEKNEVESTITEIDLSEKAKIAMEEIISEEEDALFSEFSSFLQNKMEMSESESGGAKQTSSSGIDLLDAILGGGFAIGALNMIVGQPGSGKTMLAIQALAKMMNTYEGKVLSAFLDSEEATTKVRLRNLGVKYPTNLISDITIEKVFQFIEGLSTFKKQKDIIDIPSMVIWDSIANTSSQREREVEDINQVIGLKARLLSMLLPKYIAKSSQHNICLIAVNQLREVLDMGGPFNKAPKDLKFMSQSRTIPGGQAIKYNAFHLIEMKSGQVLTQDKYGFDGVKTNLKCIKNKLFQPNIEIELLGSFNSGFSNFWTNYEFMNKNDRLKTGAWNYLVSYPEKKFRTKDALTLYRTDEEFRIAYDAAAKETIQTEIIDKYSLESLS